MFSPRAHQNVFSPKWRENWVRMNFFLIDKNAHMHVHVNFFKLLLFISFSTLPLVFCFFLFFSFFFFWQKRCPFFLASFFSFLFFFFCFSWAITWVFWLNIAKNRVYLWYVYCSNLFGEIRREANFGNGIAEILRKSKREERKMMWHLWEREKGISAMILPKIKNKITELWQLNCRNWMIKKKKKRKLNYGKSNALATNYFTIFLQTSVITNFLLLIKAHQ